MNAASDRIYNNRPPSPECSWRVCTAYSAALGAAIESIRVAEDNLQKKLFDHRNGKVLSKMSLTQTHDKIMHFPAQCWAFRDITEVYYCIVTSVWVELFKTRRLNAICLDSEIERGTLFFTGEKEKERISISFTLV